MDIFMGLIGVGVIFLSYNLGKLDGKFLKDKD